MREIARETYKLEQYNNNNIFCQGQVFTLVVKRDGGDTKDIPFQTTITLL